MEKQGSVFNISLLRKDLITKRVIELDVSLEQVSKDTGISKATLSRIENCKLPDIETFAKICKWLKTDVNRYF